MTVEVQEHHLVDAEEPPDQVLTSERAVDQLDLAAEDQIVRMDVEADDRRDRSALKRALFCFFQQRRVTDMHAVKKADSGGAFDLCHVLYLKKAFCG